MSKSWPPPISPKAAPTNKKGQYCTPKTNNVPKAIPTGIQMALSPTEPEKYLRMKIEKHTCAIKASVARATPFAVNRENEK
jgi:hypothetical protein